MAGIMNYGEMHFTLKNGLDMPAVGLGTIGMKNYPSLYNTLDHALESGYRLFDTSGIHGNERLLRKAFRQLLPKHSLSREDLFITSKLAPVSSNPRHVMRSFERSLENLDIGYIDLYLLQYPATLHIDPTSSRNAKMRADIWLELTKLYEESKIKAIGVANFSIRHLIQLSEVMTVGPMVNQIEWHPYNFKPEMLQYCAENNILIQAYSSFGGPSHKNAPLIRDLVVKDIAMRYEVSPAQVLLLWALQKGVAVIPKSNNPEHIRDNKQLNFRLSEEDVSMLDGLGYKNQKYAWDPTLVD